MRRQVHESQSLRPCISGWRVQYFVGSTGKRRCMWRTHPVFGLCKSLLHPTRRHSVCVHRLHLSNELSGIGHKVTLVLHVKYFLHIANLSPGGQSPQSSNSFGPHLVAISIGWVRLEACSTLRKVHRPRIQEQILISPEDGIFGNNRLFHLDSKAGQTVRGRRSVWSASVRLLFAIENATLGNWTSGLSDPANRLARVSRSRRRPEDSMVAREV